MREKQVEDGQVVAFRPIAVMVGGRNGEHVARGYGEGDIFQIVHALSLYDDIDLVKIVAVHIDRIIVFMKVSSAEQFVARLRRFQAEHGDGMARQFPWRGGV